MRLACASLLLAIALRGICLASVYCADDTSEYSRLKEDFGGRKFKQWLHEGLGLSKGGIPSTVWLEENTHGLRDWGTNVVKYLALNWKKIGMKSAVVTVKAVPTDHRKMGRWDDVSGAQVGATAPGSGKRKGIHPPGSPKKRMLILPPDEFPPNEVVAGRGSLGPAFSGRNEFPSGTIGDEVEFPEHAEDSEDGPPVDNAPSVGDPPSVEEPPPVEEPPLVEEPPPAEGPLETEIPADDGITLAPAPADLTEDFEILSFQDITQFLGV